MANAALALVGLAAVVGIALAVNHADAKEPAPTTPDPIPDPPIGQNPPASTPGAGNGGGSGGGAQGSGTGSPGAGTGANPVVADASKLLLPSELQNINLSGHEQYEYLGVQVINQDAFNAWIVHDTLNGMNMVIYVEVIDPGNWISMFVHHDPAGSDPPSHYILYKISDGSRKQWMLDNLFQSTPAESE